MSPASRTSSRATASASRQTIPCVEAPGDSLARPDLFLVNKEKHRSHPAGLQSGLSSTLMAPSLSGYLHACAHAHPYPSVAQGLVVST